jgi:hypothetical protein
VDGIELDFRDPVRLVAKLCDRLADRSNVVAPLEIELLGEVINRVFEIHIRMKAVDP